MTVTCQVDNPEAARVFARGRGTRYLGPYFESPTSITQAAAHLDAPLARVNYWTHRWHDLGVLTVADTIARAGRPIRLYRTTADIYEIPASLLPDAMLRTRLEQTNRILLEGLEEAAPDIALGGVLRVSKQDSLHSVSVQRDWPTTTPVRRRDVYQVTLTARLTTKEATQLRDELEALRQRWSQPRTRPGSATHIVSLALSPLPSRLTP